jgi:hypothetical protein
MANDTEARQAKGKLMKYAKITDRITIPKLPPDNSVDVVLLFRYNEAILQIGNERWKWQNHGPRWEEGVDPADAGV